MPCPDRTLTGRHPSGRTYIAADGAAATPEHSPLTGRPRSHSEFVRSRSRLQGLTGDQHKGGTTNANRAGHLALRTPDGEI